MRMQPWRGPCFYRQHHVTAFDAQYWGYESWEELWMDYTVFTVARNPFDRAASGYDYILQRRVRSCRPLLHVCPGRVSRYMYR